MKRKKKHENGLVSSLKRTLAFLLLSLALCLGLTGCGFTPFPFGNEETLSICALDVGQGDAFLLHKDGEWVLIDTGDTMHREELLQALHERGVRSLKAVMISHDHADHTGGLYAVVRSIPVECIYETGISEPTAVGRAFRKEAEERGIPCYALQAGDRVSLFPDVSFETVGPSRRMYGAEGRIDLNNCSLAGRLTYGEFSMLFTGDAEKPEEMDIMKTGAVLRSDVLKVGHHGSRTSTSAAFLRAVRPRAAVISAGSGNSYGLPHDVTIDKLRHEKIAIYRTDRDGTIRIDTKGNSQFDVYRESGGEAA